MEFLKITAYLQKHAVPAAFVAFLVAPATWGVVRTIHADQFATYQGRIDLLKDTLAAKEAALMQALNELSLMKDINARALQPTRSTDYRRLFNASPNADTIAKALQ